MAPVDSLQVPRFRLGLLLWLAGMLGAVVLTFTVLPHFLREMPELPGPLWVLVLASLGQSAAVFALAAWAGVALAPTVGLHAPAFEAAAARRPLGPALAPQLLPGLVAGVAGGILLFFLFRFAPAAVAELQQRFTPPLVARLLYGGITEELLLRWGFMTVLVWLAWRILQRRTGAPRTLYVWLAIVMSALVFAAGHLPAAAALIGTLTPDIVVFVIVANTVFGLVFGYLYWRTGLEAAMIAHATTHLVNYVAGLIGGGSLRAP